MNEYDDKEIPEVSSSKNKKNNGHKNNSGKKGTSNKGKSTKQTGVSRQSASSSKPSAPKGSYHKSNTVLKKVGITVICAILALALMVPSFMALFGSNSTASSSSSASATATPATDSINTQYQSTVDAIAAKIQEDPTNTTYLETITTEYYQWALELMNSASSTDDYTQIYTCLSKTLTYANQYVDAGGSSETVLMERAIATYYTGDTASAISYMQAVCDGDPANAAAWANLGMFYQSSGDNASATTAYNQALSTATDSQSSLKDYVNQQLSSMSDTSSTSTSGSSSSSSSTQ